MIDFTIPEEIEKLKESTQKFIFDTVIPMEKDKRQDNHGPHDTLRKELNQKAKKAGLLSIDVYTIFGDTSFMKVFLELSLRFLIPDAKNVINNT